MKVYFDVGANDGHSMVSHANSEDSIVYAFEPTPEMIDKLKHHERRYPGRYVIVPKAVSNVAGKALFHVSGQADWGCSSLCAFNDNLEKTWPGRTDFKVTQSIEVEVITLRDFVIENDIEEIEYLHVDAQGQDLEVLMGLGDKIGIVKAGVIEMPTRHETKLYKNQKYLVSDAIDFLESQGLKITSRDSNDMFENEVNLRFARKNM